MPYKTDRQRRFVRAKASEGVPWARKFAADSEIHKGALMTQTRYGNGGTLGRRIVDPPEPVDKAFGLPSLSALKTSAGKVGYKNTAYAAGSMIKPKLTAGLGKLTATPGRTLATIGGVGLAANLMGRHSAHKEDMKYGPYAKGVSPKAALGGRPSLKFLDGPPTPKKIAIGGGAIAGTGALVYSATPAGRQARREGKAAGLLARSSSEYRSLPRSERRRLAQKLVASTSRPSDVGKYYDPENRRQRRLGAAEAGLGLSGGYVGFKGAKGVRETTRAGRKLTGVVGRSADKDATATANSVVRSGKGILVRRKNVAQLAGGAALLGGAGLVRQHAEGKHGRRAWN